MNSVEDMKEEQPRRARGLFTNFYIKTNLFPFLQTLCVSGTQTIIKTRAATSNYFH